jgi:hypothetical protein
VFDAPEGPARGAFFFYDSECGSTNDAVGVTPTVAVGEAWTPVRGSALPPKEDGWESSALVETGVRKTKGSGGIFFGLRNR